MDQMYGLKVSDAAVEIHASRAQQEEAVLSMDTLAGGPPAT
jgi:hypothetical protein